tara:strand:+ start:79 stop:519 length:441 start_codon:yes stop_codon:yes gene_type:complete
MYHSKDERPRGAVGYPLDSDKLAQVILTKYDMREWHTVKPLTSVLVYGTDKSWAIVNTEGVGREAEDYDTHSVVDFSLERPGNSDTSKFISGDSIELTWNEVEQCRVPNAEIVDLADFIRAFGYRLHRNHQIWYRFTQAFSELETV